MTTTTTPDRFTALPGERTLASTITAPEEHGFSVEVADDLDTARKEIRTEFPDRVHVVLVRQAIGF